MFAVPPDLPLENQRFYVKNLKNLLTLDEFGGKRQKSVKSVKLGEIAFFTDVFHVCRLVLSGNPVKMLRIDR